MKTKIDDVQIIRKAMNWNPQASGMTLVTKEHFDSVMASINWKRDNWADGDIYVRVGSAQRVGFAGLDGRYFLSTNLILAANL